VRTSRCGVERPGEDATVVWFSDGTEVFPRVAGEPVPAAVRRFKADGYFLGRGTDTGARAQWPFAQPTAGAPAR
jgi:hypothetical protein